MDMNGDNQAGDANRLPPLIIFTRLQELIGYHNGHCAKDTHPDLRKKICPFFVGPKHIYLILKGKLIHDI